MANRMMTVCGGIPTLASTMSTPMRHTGRGLRGILAPALRLNRWLTVVFVLLVAACAARYLMRHGFGPEGVGVLTGATILAVCYAGRGLEAGRAWWPTAWVVVVVLLWATLTALAPSFAWTAVPLAFAALQVLPFRYAVAVVVLMTAWVTVSWLRISDGFDPTVVAGPVGIALITVIAYRALEREAITRQRLLEDLTAAQSDLAAAERRSGALAERTRLSREIHDSVGQGLSSINLLLNAADEDWERRPDTARQHVRTAATTARDGLDEVRRVVRDLAPARLEADETGDALPAALRALLQRSATGLEAALRVDGTPRPVPEAVAGGLVRTARGALANVLEHAHASRVVLTLTYQPDEVILDVRDDGVGFTPGPPQRGGARGHGLPGIHDRVAALEGRVTVESAPGDGTTVSVAVPTPRGD